MKRCIKYIVFLSVVCLFSFCTKFGKNITIKGRVLNPITGEPISGITVFLYKADNFKTIKETISNTDGTFELDANYLGTAYAQINYDNYQQYYNLGWLYNGKYYLAKQVTKGKVMHLDYHLVPYGQLHWHIKNVNCEGATDTLWYKIKYQYDDDFLPAWSFPIIGCADIDENGSDKEVMGNHIIYMKIKRPSGTIYKYDTVYVQEEGITNFDLFY